MRGSHHGYWNYCVYARFATVCFLVACCWPRVAVSQSPCAAIDFHASQVTSCTPALLTFTATGAPLGSEYYWDFGNGFVKGTDTVFKSYTQAGRQTISLLVKLPTSAYCDTIIKQDYITILASPTPRPYATPQELCNGPDTVTFSDSTASIVSREWIIDGYQYTNAAQTISHVFTSPGNKSVTLRVENGNGCEAIFTQSDFVKIFSNVQADFCATMNFSGSVTSVQFRPSITPGNLQVASYQWTFQNGSPATSTQQNPTVNFPSGQASDVTLQITTNSGCSYSFTRQDFVMPLAVAQEDSICVGEVVTIDDLTSGTGRGFFGWNFGSASIDDQGANSFDLIYSNSGYQSMALSYRYSQNGCQNLANIQNVVYVKGPEVKFTSNSRFHCDTPASIPLTGQVNNPPNTSSTYTWHLYDTLGNPLPGTPIGPLSSPGTTYTLREFGFFDVELVVANSNGCTVSSRSNQFLRIGQPVADFAADTQVVCSKSPIQLTDLTQPASPQGNTYTYEWEVQHADSSMISFNYTSQTPTVLLKVPGKYHVTMIVKNGTTCADTITKNNFLTVNGVNGTISLSSAMICTGESAGAEVNIWSMYPDNSTSSLDLTWKVPPPENVTIDDDKADSTGITFHKNGCYGVTALVENQTGCKASLTKLGGVCVGTNPVFETDSNFCGNVPIQLQDKSGQGPTGWEWVADPPTASFLPSATDPNAQVIFQQDTTYHLSLVTSKIIGPNDICYDTSTHVIDIHTPVAHFTTEDTLLYCAPATVHFSSTSQHYDELHWNFGDGSTLETSNTAPFYSYPRNNLQGWTVELVALTNEGCTDTFLQENLIRVLGPMPEFTISDSVGCEEVAVQFTNNSQNVVSFLFDYGDATLPDTGAIHPHTYTASGLQDSTLYTPTLVGRDAFNCTASYTDSILVYNSPVADFTADKPVGCRPLSVKFEDRSQRALEWAWDLDGDGLTDTTGQHPQRTYPDTDTIDVRLAVTGLGGCQDTLVQSDFIRVAVEATPRFSMSAHSGCDSVYVEFTDLSTHSTQMVLDYGDNSTPSFDTLLPHVYRYDYVNGTADSMIFYPTLKAMNGLGCFSEYQDTVVVYANPQLQVTTDTTEGCAPLEVELTGMGNFTHLWEWHFDGDGLTDARGTAPTYIFPPGTFDIKAISTSTHGCKDSLLLESYISARQPPRVAISYSDSAICPGDSVLFRDQSYSPGRLVAFSWSFGTPLDSSQLPNPQWIIYPTPGYYDVSLAVTDESGCTDTGTFSGIIHVKDSAAPPPPAIRYVTVEDNQWVKVYWEESELNDFSSYFLHREDATQNPLKTTTQVADTSYGDNGPIDVQQRSYCYAAGQIDECGNTSALSPWHCTIVLDVDTLAASTNELTWTPYRGWNTVAGYEVFRAVDSTDTFRRLASLPGSQTTYVDRELCDSRYCYYVVAIHPNGNYRSRSNSACAQPRYIYPTKAPILATVTVLDSQMLFVRWQPMQHPNLLHYHLDRQHPDLGWEEDVAVTQGTEFVDMPVDIDREQMQYRVQMEDECRQLSPYSNPGHNIVATSRIDNDAVTLSWTPYREWLKGVNSYHVQLWTGSFWKKVGTTSGQDTTFIDTAYYQDLEAPWCYRIVGYERLGDSSISNNTCVIFPSRIWAPNAFSPNSDGINDVFNIKSTSLNRHTGQSLLDYEMKIYNRWGQLVFVSRDWEHGWRGLINGRMAPAGVYLYTVSATGYDGFTYERQGNLTLMR